MTAVTSTSTQPSVLGIWVSLLKLVQSKISITSVSITPTRAARGMASMSALPASTKSVMQAAQVSPDTRLRPPDLTLMTDWAIIPQPPIVPKRPLAMFAAPWPMHSVCVSVRRPVISSTSCWVRSVSMRPTAATLTAYGRTTRSVSGRSGTAGQCGAGRPPATLARSPTVLVATPAALRGPAASAVRNAMLARGAGMAFVTRGQIWRKTIETAVRPTMMPSSPPDSQAPPDLNCSIWERPIKRASPLTNPNMTGRGTRRMNFPSLRTPASTCSPPASSTPANRYSRPCEATRGAQTTAVAPAAPEITPGCAPKAAATALMTTAACNPTAGGTPATNVKASDSGIMARETVRPARTWPSHAGAASIPPPGAESAPSPGAPGAALLLDFLAALGTLKNSAYTRGFLAAKAEALGRLQAS